MSFSLNSVSNRPMLSSLASVNDEITSADKNKLEKTNNKLLSSLNGATIDNQTYFTYNNYTCTTNGLTSHDGAHTNVNSRSKLLLWCSDSLANMAGASHHVEPDNKTDTERTLFESYFDSTNEVTFGNVNGFTNKDETSLANLTSTHAKMPLSDVACSTWSCPMCGREENKFPETLPDAVRILSCFHQICATCCESIPINNSVMLNGAGSLSCPVCRQVTNMSSKGVRGLMTKALWRSLFPTEAGGHAASLVGDIPTFRDSGGGSASTDDDDKDIGLGIKDKHSLDQIVPSLSSTSFPPPCSKHPAFILSYICKTCDIFTCQECFASEHAPHAHDFISLDGFFPGSNFVPTMATMNIGDGHVLRMAAATSEGFNDRAKVMIDVIKGKLMEYEIVLKTAEKMSHKLQAQYLQAKREVGVTTMNFHNAIENRKSEIMKELEAAFTAKEFKISLISQKLNDFLQKSAMNFQLVEKFSTSSKEASSEAQMQTIKQLFDPRISWILNLSPSVLAHQISNYDLEFITYAPAIPNIIKNAFGHIKETTLESPYLSKTIQNFWRDEGSLLPIDMQNLKQAVPSISDNLPNSSLAKTTNSNSLLPSNTSDLTMSDITQNLSTYEKWCNSVNQIHALNNSLEKTNEEALSNPNALTSSSNDNVKTRLEQAKKDNLALSSLLLHHNMNSSSANNKILEMNLMGLTMEMNNNSAIPLISEPFCPLQPQPGHPIYSPSFTAIAKSSQNQIKRRKMIYHCKFGEFGLLEAQFTEPSGVAVNAQGDIIVADTNNHRIQIFDREGRFKFQFGECGKRDGQLLYPNRVAAVRTSGDIVVTERSPTHQIQIFDKFGRFLRKFGADVLQHPRGVTVDPEGKIVIVECKVMRVVIFDHLSGEVLHKFGCSKHLEFPNGLAVNDRKEIFISDNRAHSVKVFNYQGHYLRQIGGPGITNYPIGVGIEYSTGRLLVADNHNNFNLTIFDQQGTLLDALESKVKHAQCFDVALLDDDSMVLASKDFRIYVYRYNNNDALNAAGLQEGASTSSTDILGTGSNNTSSGNSLSPINELPLVSLPLPLISQHNVLPLKYVGLSTPSLHPNLHHANLSENKSTLSPSKNSLNGNSKVFEHPSLAVLNQNWHQNWLLITQQHQMQQQLQQQQLQNKAQLQHMQPDSQNMTLLENSCYDRALKTACSVLAPPVSSSQGSHLNHTIATSYDEDSAHPTSSPDLASIIEGPLKTFGYYQAPYWSPYDSVLAFVNDSRVPDRRFSSSVSNKYPPTI
ncbi:unnamed protein product [Gordionus sp. m RMFG-2023]|uniref:tripartite motif-containing protein 2-like n=1 Tax=Gordionus sp. m RMFG-2023 TaxID=3053472 RepID=UPI0030E500D6